MDFYGFYTGEIFDAYEFLGAHTTADGTTFRTFAPQAQKVELLLGDRCIPMEKIYNGQFFEVTVGEVPFDTAYEYRIYSHGRYTDHCDPYGSGMELRPAHKSILRDIAGYRFHDESWMKKRSDMKNKPLNIYEVHAGSFRKPEARADAWYNYEELGDVLIPYLKECGYNYVELLPICEHPCDESWGYQTTGYFSPTSRYGTPQQLMKLIDRLHQNDIGIILDFVPVHFAVDAYALANYDGSALYEYPNNDVGHSEWGSCNFMHSRGEVRSFLQSSANYWLKEFHFDGLRMDAISNIIYWQGDERRGVNANAVQFVRTMNRQLKQLNPGCMLIAEDSTSFRGITTDYEKGGLGFDYKWDLGWMHDTLDFLALAPENRSEHYHKLTFSMMYFGDENYLLPLSHDEVVHGKGTIVNKLYGNAGEKRSQAKSLYLYMTAHPGKKLNFMGNELAQFREWDEKRQQDFDLLNDPYHKGFHEYMKRLNQLYLSCPAFSEKDYSKEGFEWADCHQEQKVVYAITRRSAKETLLSVFNFSGCQQEYAVKLPDGHHADLLLCSDEQRWGGYTADPSVLYRIENDTLHLTLPAYSSFLFRC